MAHLMTGVRLLSVVSIFLMAIAAPRGMLLHERTVPTASLLLDRFTHYHYTGRMFCDVGKMVGLCGDVGSLTDHIRR